MPEGLLSANPFGGPLLHHHGGQALGKGDIVESRPGVPQPLAAVVAHFVRLVVGQTADPWPSVLRGRAHHPEDLVQLVEDVAYSREAWVAVKHLHENAPYAPYVQ